NSYKGSRETVAVTEKALNDGLATTYGPKRKPPKQRLTLVRHPGTIGTLTKEEKEFWYDIPVDNMQFLQLTVPLGA
ncbi:hypothetical protein PVK64_20665, partial [Aliivibrio sp. S4TY2]|uniref:hypothetical protein n=1 Tax=unclassified Aliivibrio TaxID=2645654 RepID=UPI002379AA0F